MERFPPDPDVQQWVLQPLADAGLDRDTIEALLFRLGFEAVVGPGPGLHPGLQRAAGDQSPAVRTALTQTIHRMLIAG